MNWGTWNIPRTMNTICGKTKRRSNVGGFCSTMTKNIFEWWNWKKFKGKLAARKICFLFFYFNIFCAHINCASLRAINISSVFFLWFFFYVFCKRTRKVFPNMAAAKRIQKHNNTKNMFFLLLNAVYIISFSSFSKCGWKAQQPAARRRWHTKKKLETKLINVKKRYSQAMSSAPFRR